MLSCSRVHWQDSTLDLSRGLDGILRAVVRTPAHGFGWLGNAAEHGLSFS